MRLSNILATGILIAAGLGYELRNVPEEAVNFHQPNAEVVSYNIETEGDVVKISRHSRLDSIPNGAGNTIYSGNVSFCTRPPLRSRFYRDHVDPNGNTREDSNYFCDEGPGSFIIVSRD